MRSIEERFWPKVKKTDGCWLWIGGKDRHGYGSLWDQSRMRTMLAHRISYEIENRTRLSPSKMVLHCCDTPSCVNPQHLRVGTQKENFADAVQKKRMLVGEKNGQARLTKEKALLIRELGGKLSQRKIAAIFGVAQGTIWRVLHGAWA